MVVRHAATDATRAARRALGPYARKNVSASAAGIGTVPS